MHTRTLLPCLLMGLLLACGPSTTFSASTTVMSVAERAERSGAIVLGTVKALDPYRGGDNLIRTTATLRVDEIFKGAAPPRIAVTYRGGRLSDEGETPLNMPGLEVGEQRLFFFSGKATERLTPIGGPAGAMKVRPAGAQPQEATEDPGFLRELRDHYPEPVTGNDLGAFATGEPEAVVITEETSATPASLTPEQSLFLPPRRYTIPDRGEPIRYQVDIDDLPGGISESQAMEALGNALEAWEEVSSVTFAFDGFASFGQAASDVEISDGRLRIQLHDTYDVVAESVLGIGGHSYQPHPDFPEGGSGGTIGGVDFHGTARSYVVMNHLETGNQNPATFEAALTHEVGHALGLAHSSEDSGETDPYLRQAIMFFAIHTDDRGATLNQWDRDAIAIPHPEGRSAPFGFDRFMRIVTSDTPLENPEVNQVELRGYSLFAQEVEPVLLAVTDSNGVFDLSDGVLSYTANHAFSDSGEDDPEGQQFFERALIRYSDGEDLSPPVEVYVMQYLLDTQANGLPDSWAEEHFGSAVPQAGFSGPHDDPDGDGFTNLQEFLLGTDPLDGNSRFFVSDIAQGILEFPVRPYEVYELFESTDLETWESTGRAVQPTTGTGQTNLPAGESESKKFYRLELVP